MKQFFIQFISIVLAFAIWDLIKFAIKTIVRNIKNGKDGQTAD